MTVITEADLDLSLQNKINNSMQMLTIQTRSWDPDWSTLYFDANGNDETGDGTLQNPWRDFQKFLSSLKGKYITNSLEIRISGDYGLASPMIKIEDVGGKYLEIDAYEYKGTFSNIRLERNTVSLSVKNVKCSSITSERNRLLTLYGLSFTYPTTYGIGINGGEVIITACNFGNNKIKNGLTVYGDTTVTINRPRGSVEQATCRVSGMGKVYILNNEVKAPVQYACDMGGKVIYK